jgi:FixJ family two-component response regulator
MSDAPQTIDVPIVLIVDDDEILRATLDDLFASVGLQSISFASASAFLAFPVPMQPCCLILDLRLPGTSGLEIQAHLARMERQIPIIFVTGHADVPTSVRAMKAGAFHFLTKPFLEQDLLDLVSEALRLDAARLAEAREIVELRVLADQLTRRERDVLRGVMRGLLNKQIAHELGISEITVKMHRSSAGRKLRCVSVADMLRKLELLKL